MGLEGSGTALLVIKAPGIAVVQATGASACGGGREKRWR